MKLKTQNRKRKSMIFERSAKLINLNYRKRQRTQITKIRQVRPSYLRVGDGLIVQLFSSSMWSSSVSGWAPHSHREGSAVCHRWWRWGAGNGGPPGFSCGPYLCLSQRQCFMGSVMELVRPVSLLTLWGKMWQSDLPPGAWCWAAPSLLTSQPIVISSRPLTRGPYNMRQTCRVR